MPVEFLRKSTAILLMAVLTVGFLFGMMTPAQAAPAYQLTSFPTPTPGPDGRIVYTVQDGDTLFRIAAVSELSLNELLELNNLDADSIIRPGQVLLLGLVSAPVATAEPGATIPPAPQTDVTPTPLGDASTICALLYLDANGNAFRDEDEIALPDGEVSVTERLGAFSNKGTTSLFNDEEPLCFENIPPGEYIITMALPTDFNRTTDLSLTIQLAPGDTSFINFGAQPSSIARITPDVSDPASGDGGSGTLLAVLGATVLLAGLGIGIYASTSGRRRFSMSDDE
ncbi:MAG TPA: LysM peptidoglycan-binding domain-containing protein [Anaerolineales bacterium]|nr:LysM peptidoglycan-binding domain-containing protein [Anaerolineales bacterium]